MNIESIIKELTLEEKASLCSGKNFWNTKAVQRLNIPSIMMTDGPHGLRKQEGDADHVGLNESAKATCFPTASATASSWDRELMYQIGKALGEECLQEKVAVILGPGANIKRSPLCGRNFEYISEDPYLTGEMASAIINGTQSKNIGTSLKHYALNNQEKRRMAIDSVADERAQREIYLAGFEAAVKNAKPWTVMCSYNKEEGTYLSEHRRLLNDILKQEWGFNGVVVTDWGAINDRVAGLKAGLDLEMPSSGGKTDAMIVDAVKSGNLSEEILDKSVKRLLELIIKSRDAEQEGYKYDAVSHHELAKRAAGESAVLLKNNDILPLSKELKVAVIGEFAKTPRYQGTGSSKINPHKVDNVFELLDEMGISYEYAKGYDLRGGKPNAELVEEAAEAAKNADAAVIFAGLPDEYESEGFDREHMSMPENHNHLIEEIAKVNPNTIVVLQNGAPVEMPWIDSVKGVLECYLGGEAGCTAAVQILFGDINPSGKLAETFPIRLEDNPSYNYFPGNQLTVEYRESIYAGYRYYDKADKDVLFPFGYGLSYTSFEYSDLNVQDEGENEYKVTFKIKNTGKMAGAETAQLYIKNNESAIFKAEKELRAFDKVYLEPDEEKTVTLKLNTRSFAYYNTEASNWHVESGEYGILVGASSRDIRLSKAVDVAGDDSIKAPNLKDSLLSYYEIDDNVFEIDDLQFETLLGRKLPVKNRIKTMPYDSSSLLCDLQDKLFGRLLYKFVISGAKKQLVSGEEDGSEQDHFMEKILAEMPLKSIGLMGGDMVPKYFTEGCVEILNGKLFKGIGLLVKKK